MIFVLNNKGRLMLFNEDQISNAAEYAEDYPDHIYFEADLVPPVEVIPDDHPTLFAAFVEG